MVLWIGVDDTDSLRGMCTTFLAAELVRELTRRHDLIGYPRIVRLNPNVPWKTRGNAAICIRIGNGSGEPQVAGSFGRREIYGYSRGTTAPEPEEVQETVATLVERWSRFDDETTNPGFVILRRPGPPGWYWKAVRGIVSLPEALRAARGRGIVQCYKNGRGAIGALAATAWRPRDRTYEVLVYRRKSHWGTRRSIDSDSVRKMDRAFPSTFNNYDYPNRRTVIAPHSPCPILFGIRGDRAEELPLAMRAVRSEPAAGWLVFETNQGTDDHVRPRGVLEPRTTGRFSGVIEAQPRTLKGGHVILRMSGLDATVYEPAKQLRAVARSLLPGDHVCLVGSIRDRPRTLNIEKVRVDRLVSSVCKTANPSCPSCGKRMKSGGRNAPFRCGRCGTSAPRSTATYRDIPRSVHVGWYEPAVGARRHLSKPLKRFR